MLSSNASSIADAPSRPSRPFLVQRQAGPCRFFDHQPAVPVMPATMVQLDLLLGRAVLELDAIVESILGDLGATLQVLRVTARIRDGENHNLMRMCDGVVHLGRKGLRRALPRLLPSAPAGRNRAAWQLWRRAQITAELSRLLASRSTAVPPDEARMAGLLHDVGRLPMILGWRVERIDLADSTAVLCALAREWGLPSFATSIALPEAQPGSSPSAIGDIVAAAAKIANAISDARPGPVEKFDAVSAYSGQVPTARPQPHFRPALPFRVQ